MRLPRAIVAAAVAAVVSADAAVRYDGYKLLRFYVPYELEGALTETLERTGEFRFTMTPALAPNECHADTIVIVVSSSHPSRSGSFAFPNPPPLN